MVREGQECIDDSVGVGTDGESGSGVLSTVVVEVLDGKFLVGGGGIPVEANQLDLR